MSSHSVSTQTAAKATAAATAPGGRRRTKTHAAPAWNSAIPATNTATRKPASSGGASP